MRLSYSRSTRLTVVALLSATIAACSDNPVETTTTPKLGAVSMTVLSGGDQHGLASTELPNPLVVQVVDAKGHGVRDQIVNFHVVSGGGSIYAGTGFTNKDGIAQDWWTLGAAGAQTVEVRAVDPTTGEKQVFATFHATIDAPPPPPPPTIPPDAFEPNDAQQVATFIGNIANGQSFTRDANFNTLTDVDWFGVRTVDTANPGCSFLSNNEDFTFRATLSNVPTGSTYRVSIFDGANLVDGVLVNGGSQGTAVYAYSGTCGPDDARNLSVRVDRISGDPTADTYHLAVNLIEQ